MCGYTGGTWAKNYLNIYILKRQNTLVCNKSRFCWGSFIMDFFGPALAVMTTTMITETASLFIFEQYWSAADKSEVFRMPKPHTHTHIYIDMYSNDFLFLKRKLSFSPFLQIFRKFQKAIAGYRLKYCNWKEFSNQT